MSDVPLGFAQYANAVVKGKYKDIEKYWTYVLKNFPKPATQVEGITNPALAKLDKDLLQALSVAQSKMRTAATSANRGHRSGATSAPPRQ